MVLPRPMREDPVRSSWPVWLKMELSADRPWYMPVYLQASEHTYPACGVSPVTSCRSILLPYRFTRRNSSRNFSESSEASRTSTESTTNPADTLALWLDHTCMPKPARPAASDVPSATEISSSSVLSVPPPPPVVV